jgi:hypothetical protein
VGVDGELRLGVGLRVGGHRCRAGEGGGARAAGSSRSQHRRPSGCCSARSEGAGSLRGRLQWIAAACPADHHQSEPGRRSQGRVRLRPSCGSCHPRRLRLHAVGAIAGCWGGGRGVARRGGETHQGHALSGRIGRPVGAGPSDRSGGRASHLFGGGDGPGCGRSLAQ